MGIRSLHRVLGALLAVCLAAAGAAAQTGGTVTGTIHDSQGGVVPGATVILISDTRGTRGVPAVTNESGSYVLPNVTPDTYTVEVTMPGFRTAQRTGVPVSGGERVAVGILVIEPGGTSEVVDVTAEAPLIQAESGERSFTVSTTQVENLPLAGARNYAALAALTPGVNPGGVGGSRLGGTSQNNIVLDGVSNMETGSNTQNLNLNVEAIAEVRVLVQAYQAEYGRSSGLQVMGVTKSGTNRFRGSVYDIEDNSDWNTNSWQNEKNGVPKPVSKNRTWGYSIGGPVGRPGGDNKLFFFYSHEFRPSTTAGNLNRFRVPTALERQGDFSQSLDNEGRPIPQLYDPITRQPFPNNVIPADRLYQTGLQILNSFPMPNMEQVAPNAYNLEVARPEDKNLTQQPSIRVDYQLTPGLRFNGRWAREGTTRRVREGTLPGYNDILLFGTYRYTTGATVNWTINSTTFLEGTFGQAQNELIGGNSGGLLSSPLANRLATFPDFPLIYPDAGRVDPRSYQYDMLTRQAGEVPFFDGQSVNLIPEMSWGNLIGSAPPSLTYPGWVTLNRTRDVSIAVTKIAGRHTLKAGYYSNRAFKPQNTGAGGGGGGTLFQGQISFANDTNNPLDTGYGFANAATGVFNRYVQSSKLIEGRMIYNNIEFYVQDNWRATNRLTLDYGMRFTHQGPFYDTLNQMSNFFAPGAPGRPGGVDPWSPDKAPLLYVPGCRNGLTVCSGNNRMAMNPVTGELLDHPDVLNSEFAIGTVIPGSGDPTNGIRVAGDGIATSAYVWPTLVFGPRIGVAYDLKGDQGIVVRGGFGLFYDRTDGNTVFSVPNNPPIAETTTLVNGRLQTLGSGISTQGASDLRVMQYDADVPAQSQWNAGVQLGLPWASTLDVSYVGNHGYNRHGSTVNLNEVNLGAAYQPENQDPTRAGTSSVPGATALPTSLLRPYRGFGSINEQPFVYSDTYHSIQTSFNRRYRGGLSFGVNYTWSISFTGNTGLTKRLQHNPDGTFSVRADQAEYEALNKNIEIQPHVMRGNFVWDLPDLRAENVGGRIVGAILNDWQLSGIFTVASGTNYLLTYAYQNNGSAVNLTGSPDYGNNGRGARIVFVGDPGSGCSDNQYAQFNTDAVRGPTYGSVGLESGRNQALRRCAEKNIDLSIARNIQLGGGRMVQLRVDAFNAFNIVNWNGIRTEVQYTNPVDQVVRNSQYRADGSLDPSRLTPQTGGFGSVSSAGAMRTVRLTARFSF
jgi:hypothetical protein